MTHDSRLKQIKEHFDDLKIRNPQAYREEERRLALEEHRLGMRVAMSPIRIERRP